MAARARGAHRAPGGPRLRTPDPRVCGCEPSLGAGDDIRGANRRVGDESGENGAG